ncbi:hypothetical protein ACWCP6_19095 [Streptomyces sp. NPDC002004]
MPAQFDSSVLHVATSRARVSFDGTGVTVQRRLMRGLQWRPPATYAMRRILGAEFVRLGGEGERRQFDLYLTEAPTIRFSVPIGRNPHRGRGKQKTRKWNAFTQAINTASGQWMRGVLDSTLGAGQWSDDTWHHAESLTPELRVFTEWGDGLPAQRLRADRTHRQMIEDLVLNHLYGNNSSDSASSSPAPWAGFRPDRSPLDRVRAEVWFRLLAKLDYESAGIHR